MLLLKYLFTHSWLMKINPSDTSLVIFQSYLLVSDQCAAFGSREWLKWDQVV